MCILLQGKPEVDLFKNGTDIEIKHFFKLSGLDFPSPREMPLTKGSLNVGNATRLVRKCPLSKRIKTLRALMVVRGCLPSR